MKRIVLGDPHGNYKVLEDIYNKEKPDMVIILGDYCDSFIHDTPEIVSAYKKMRKLQKQHVKKHGDGTFITLLGNHDWHYISYSERYSGYKNKTYSSMHDTLQSDLKDGLLPIVYIDDKNKTIYSHAGLTKTWMSEWRVPAPEFVNQCNENGLNFQAMSFDLYGDSKWQGPLWVRPGALLYDFYGDGEWKQIVGHTRTRTGKPLMCKMPEYKSANIDDAWLIVIDTLPFVYIKEELNDDGLLVSREAVNNVEFNEKDLAQ